MIGPGEPALCAYVYEMHVGRVNHDRRRDDRRLAVSGMAAVPGLDRRARDRRVKLRRARDQPRASGR